MRLWQWRTRTHFRRKTTTVDCAYKGFWTHNVMEFDERTNEWVVVNYMWDHSYLPNMTWEPERYASKRRAMQAWRERWLALDAEYRLGGGK